jgi:hypothetical protein
MKSGVITNIFSIATMVSTELSFQVQVSVQLSFFLITSEIATDYFSVAS